MVGKNQNIKVLFDAENTITIDPNTIIDSEGNEQERAVQHENLVMYINLTCKVKPRTFRLEGIDGNVTTENLTIGEINYLKPNAKDFYDESYTNFNISELNDTIKNSTTKKTENVPNDYATNQINNSLLFIENIVLESFPSFDGKIIITFEDIKGRALMELGDNSPYGVFFTLPRPDFFLTLKGFYGQAITYRIALESWNASFVPETGNFRIFATFKPLYTDVLSFLKMDYVKPAPYMFKKYYQQSPTNISTTYSSLLTNGDSNLQQPLNIMTSDGRNKLKEVYQDYKSRGLISEGFPELSIKEFEVKLETLQKNLMDVLTKQDMVPVTDYMNYGQKIEDYEKKVINGGDSWFKTYLDTDNSFVLNNGDIVYTFRKNILDGDQKDIAVKNLESIINQNNKILADNSTFGTNPQYFTQPKIGNTIINDTSINNPITLQMIRITPDNEPDWKKTYEKTQKVKSIDKDGKETKEYLTWLGAARIKYYSIVNPVDPNSYIFRFDGENSFLSNINKMKSELQKKYDVLQTEIGKYLSSRIENYSLLGFKPTVKNAIAIIMANAECFLRMMADVHDKAWEQRENPIRKKVILQQKLPSSETKNYVETVNGGSKPVYPWPNYAVEKEPKKIQNIYPGNYKVLSDTKGYNYDVWPEIEFVEEHLKAFLQTREGFDYNFNQAENFNNLNIQNTANRVSYSALDFDKNKEIYSKTQSPDYLYEIYERNYNYVNYSRLFKPNYKNDVINAISETEFFNIQNSLGIDAISINYILKNYLLTSLNYLTTLRHSSNSGTGNDWQKYLNNTYVSNYLEESTKKSFGIYDLNVMDTLINDSNFYTNSRNRLKELVKSKNTNTFDLLDTYPFNLPDWYKTNLANGQKSNFYDIYNTSNTYEIHDLKNVISNFNITTKLTEVRPITNFNFYTSTKPNIENPSASSYKLFYEDRGLNKNIGNQQITEGTVNYLNYSGNVSQVQTTSILNTPYFINSMLTDINKWKNGDTNPFITSAYLFLNSLPLSTLREKYKTYDVREKTTKDLDYIFASMKKFAAVHKLPYAWILKYGSVWHRYKKYYIQNVDILDDVWKNFDAINTYDPISNNKGKVYSLTTPNTISINNIVLENVRPVVGGTISEMNIGFYPKIINDFNLFYRGSELFSAYTNSEIQEKINNRTGFTLNATSQSAIYLSNGYSPTSPSDSLSVKTWTCTLKDINNNKEYIIPSFGYLSNQTKYECIDNQNQLLQPILSNNAVYNGSVRYFWGLPNYGYFNQDEIAKPSPNMYLKKIISDQAQQESFSLNGSNNYATVDELLSVYGANILDLFENEFLKFSQSAYQYNTNNASIVNLNIDPNANYKNFQLLMKECMTVNYVNEEINANFRTENLIQQQYDSVQRILKNFLQYDKIFQYGNPGNFNRKLFNTFYPVPNTVQKYDLKPYVNGSLPTQYNTTNSLDYYKSLNPLAWIALSIYVGESVIDGLKYSKKGSYVTDFFPDMNIEFNENNVQTLAPIIKIYATQKSINPTLNKEKFEKILSDNYDTQTENLNNTLDSTLNKARTNLPNVKDTTKGDEFTSILQGEIVKDNVWNELKELNDRYISAEDYSKGLFFENILFLDRANRDISDKIFFDPKSLLDRLKATATSQGSDTVISLINYIGKDNRFNYIYNLPSYVNFYSNSDINKVSNQFDSSTDIGNTIFGTYLNVNTIKTSPKYVFVFAEENSQYLDNGLKQNDYKNDGFKTTDPNSPLLESPLGKPKEYFNNSNRVVSFQVDFNKRNQNLFKKIDISTTNPVQTYEAAKAELDILKQNSGRQVATQSYSLYNTMASRTYGCKVTSMGNVMIQPMMYFDLQNVPLFHGTYVIQDVKHYITSDKFETEFGGYRCNIMHTTTIDNYVQFMYKKLFDIVNPLIKQQVDTNLKNNPTANSNPNSSANTQTNNVLTNNSKIYPGPNLGPITNSQSGQQLIVSQYNYFIPVVGNQTSISPTDIVLNINNSVAPQLFKQSTPVTANLIDLNKAKLMTFVTLYMESFDGHQFTTYNNNLCGAKLNYAFPGNLPTFFNQEYISRIDNDGKAYPYATFSSSTEPVNMIMSKWLPRVSTFTVTPESIAQNWIMYWSALFSYGRSMKNEEFSKFNSNYPQIYGSILSRVKDAIDLAKSLGIMDIY